MMEYCLCKTRQYLLDMQKIGVGWGEKNLFLSEIKTAKCFEVNVEEQDQRVWLEKLHGQ